MKLQGAYHRWRSQVWFSFPAALATLFVAVSPQSAWGQQDVHAPLIARADRKPAPHLSLVGEDGRSKQVASYKGKVVLLNFWATTCGGCILEIPSFIDLESAYGKEGFTAVGISAEIPYEGVKTPAEAWQRVRPFIASHHVNYPVLMGTPSVIDSFGFKAYPATYLLDKSGRIAASYFGVVSKQNVEENVKTLLAEGS